MCRIFIVLIIIYSFRSNNAEVIILDLKFPGNGKTSDIDSHTNKTVIENKLKTLNEVDNGIAALTETNNMNTTKIIDNNQSENIEDIPTTINYNIQREQEINTNVLVSVINPINNTETHEKSYFDLILNDKKKKAPKKKVMDEKINKPKHRFNNSFDKEDNKSTMHNNDYDIRVKVNLDVPKTISFNVSDDNVASYNGQKIKENSESVKYVPISEDLDVVGVNANDAKYKNILKHISKILEENTAKHYKNNVNDQFNNMNTDTNINSGSYLRDEDLQKYREEYSKTQLDTYLRRYVPISEDILDLTSQFEQGQDLQMGNKDSLAFYHTFMQMPIV